MNNKDPLPWYRQFWPWFLIAVPACTVVAGLYTVFLAMRTTDSLVVNAVGGMDIVAERHLAAERHAVSMGLWATLEVDADTGTVRAILHSNLPQSWPNTLHLELSHPTHAARDRTLTLTTALPNELGEPAWVGHFVDQTKGRWYVILEAEGVAAWRLNGIWLGETEIDLHPASVVANNDI